MGKPTVSAGYPRTLLEFAVSRGADRQTLLARSHIQEVELQNQDNRIPLANYLAMLDAGIASCNEPALALQYGEAVTMPDISIVGLLGQASGGSEAGRQQVARYARLAVDEDDGDPSYRMEVIREGGDLWLRSTSRLYVEHPHLTESAFARCVCGVRGMMASVPGMSARPFPKAIHFTHREPSYRSEYERIFGVPLFFESSMNAIVVDEALMAVAMPPQNPYLAEVLRARAEELLADLERSKSMRGRVESLLIPMLHTGHVTVEMIAAKLALSRHTLYRRLRAEGVTFEQVLDGLRHTMALDYLRRRKASVQETAFLVGFSDAGAFSRAFKRWTGSSPRAARRAKGE